jgi:HlyD family secretion protein
MGIKVTFLGAEPEEKKGAVAPAALIPPDAVRDDNGKKIVFIVRDGRVERRAVTTGGTRGTALEIQAGLNAGDSVVVKGPVTLRDGQAVEIKK